MESFPFKLATALKAAAEVGMTKAEAPGREQKFTTAFVEEIKGNLSNDGVDVHETHQHTEGATGSDIALSWKYQDFDYSLHLQIKFLYNNYPHYCNTLALSEKHQLAELEQNPGTSEAQKRFEELKKKFATRTGYRDSQGTRWSECEPWFDAVYKSKANDTNEVYQALAIQDVVEYEEKTKGSTSRGAFLLFKTDVAEASIIELPEMAKLCSRDASNALTVKLMDGLNGEQLHAILKKRLLFAGTFVQVTNLSTWLETFMEK